LLSHNTMRNGGIVDGVNFMLEQFCTNRSRSPLEAKVRWKAILVTLWIKRFRIVPTLVLEIVAERKHMLINSTTKVCLPPLLPWQLSWIRGCFVRRVYRCSGQVFLSLIYIDSAEWRTRYKIIECSVFSWEISLIGSMHHDNNCRQHILKSPRGDSSLCR